MVYTENEISPLQIEWVCLDNKKIDSQPQTILERTNTFYYHILIANEEADSKACISYLPFFPHLFQLKRSRIEKKILTFYFCTDSNKSNCLKSNCTDSNKSTFAHKGYHGSWLHQLSILLARLRPKYCIHIIQTNINLPWISL